VGLASTTASVLGVPLMHAMRERYPDVRLHMVESMSGHVTAMLNARQLDLAVLFDTGTARRWSVMPLLEEKLFLIGPLPLEKTGMPPSPGTTRMAQLKGVPLILPTGSHGLRSTLDAAFARAKFQPHLVAEIDSLAMLMDMVSAGLGSTGPHCRRGAARFQWSEIADAQVSRTNALCSLSDDELSPAALATRVVLADCARELVRSGRWVGATLVAN
jgi:LysR family tcuABC transcriptional regulator